MKSICFLAFLLPISLLAQIGAKTQQTKITGLWQNSQFGYQMTLMLNPDGSGEFDGESINYSTNTNKLLIIQSGQTTTYTFLLQGNSLTLSGGDLDDKVTFTKAGTESTQSPVAISQEPNIKTDSKNSLLGVWSGNGETIEFKNNGQCIYLGNTFPYEESQGHVILTTQQGKAMFAYTIQGDQLNLTANGQKVTYTRGAANQSAQANSQNKNGDIAQELVGKWCWTNVTSTNSGGSTSSRCIVLNANGTYEYASERSMDTNTNAFYAGTSSQGSDRGTWYVQGDRIYYNSQTSGQGSYQLQKINHPKTRDPMIVLDGEAYVTFYQKPSW
jgi:hypothetical protein